MASITKRGDTYRFRVSLGYDTAGKQIMKTTTWAPPSNLSPTKQEKEAQKQAMLFEERVRSGEYLGNGNLRLSEFCPQYLAMIKDKVSPITYMTYERAIARYILPTMGHYRLQDVRPFHVQSFILELSRDGTRQDGRGTKLKAATVRRYLVILQSIFAKAYKLGLIAQNPTDGDKLQLPQVEEPEVEVFSREETAELLAYLEGEPLKYQVLVQLAILTGCRRGELVALQWDCIDLKAQTVTVRQSNYKLTGEEVRTKAPKTKRSVRTVSIPPYSVELLRQYRAAQIEERLSVGDQWKDGGWLFTQWDGSPMYPTTPTLWFTRFLKAHGLRHRKFHALRHTSATLLLSSGTDIKTVANRLGHTQISTTNRYLHALEEADKGAAQSLEVMFSGHMKKMTVG